LAELTLAEAASATGGRLVQGEASLVLAGYSIDSRTLRAGELFFALEGPNHNGHAYLGAAFAAGAAGAVVSTEAPAPPGGALLRVADTTRALQDLAAHVRRRERVKVIGITGSAGKTTTKEMTFAALSGPLKAYRSEGNYNNLFGLPLALLRMPAGTQVAVLEMGMSYAGEIRRLTEIAAPDVGVLLNIGRAHLANFGSPEEIVSAKAELFEGMGSRGTGIFNADDDRARRVADSFEGFVFTFGIDRPADLEASQVTPEGFSGMRLNIRHGGSVWPAQLGFVGVHHVYNLLAALAAGYMLGCDLPGMIERVGRVAPLAGRGERFELPGGMRVIDDTYNSNPAALKRAIGALAAAAPAGSRRVLVTGDMLELGEYAPEAHREAGRAAADARIEALVAVGPLSEGTAEAARERGVQEVTHFPESGAAAAAVSSWARPGDTLLVKGSRGMRMERIVSALRGSTQESKTH